MNIVQERAQAAARGLDRLDLDFLAYVPSKSIAPIIEHFIGPNAPATPRAFPVAREEEAMGIIGGAVLAGRRGAIVMQDNGFGNALTALTTFCVAYHLPVLIVANTRGGLGEYNSMIHTVSEGVPDMLRAAHVPMFLLDRRSDPADWEATVREAGQHAHMTYRPVAVLLEFWDGARGGGVA